MAPKKLTDLQDQEHVLRTNKNAIEAIASGYFEKVINDNKEVDCKKLFTEDQYTVYQCCTGVESGIFLYIISY